MKFLVISGSNEIVVVRDENEARRVEESTKFDKVIHLDESSARSNVLAFPSAGGTPGGVIDLNAQVEELESKLIAEAMKATNNNQIKAAQRLRLTRGALQYKLKKYFAKPAEQGLEYDDKQAA